jgi:hypothetical protein
MDWSFIDAAVGTACQLGLSHRLGWPGAPAVVDMRILENFNCNIRCQSTMEKAIESYKISPVHAGEDEKSIRFWADAPKWVLPVVTIDPVTGDYILLDGAHRLAVHYFKTQNFLVKVCIV